MPSHYIIKQYIKLILLRYFALRSCFDSDCQYSNGKKKRPKLQHFWDNCPLAGVLPITSSTIWTRYKNAEGLWRNEKRGATFTTDPSNHYSIKKDIFQVSFPINVKKMLWWKIYWNGKEIITDIHIIMMQYQFMASLINFSDKYDHTL